MGKNGQFGRQNRAAIWVVNNRSNLIGSVINLQVILFR